VDKDTVEGLKRIAELEASRVRIGRQTVEMLERIEVLEAAVSAIENRIGLLTQYNRVDPSSNR
jgi:hypothetical protein